MLVISATPSGGSNATGNTVKDNDIKDNSPVDIFWDSLGTNPIPVQRLQDVHPGPLQHH